MQNENRVIGSVCAHLTREGWSIRRFAHTSQSGIDVEAAKDERLLLIEAKGETSSSSGSSRFGRPFDTGQCYISFSAALYKAMSLQAQHPNAIAAVALPDNSYYRRLVRDVHTQMCRLGVEIFWTREDGSVMVEFGVESSRGEEAA